MSSNTVNQKVAFKDAEFMYRVVQHIEGRPNVNWDGVAATLGYKSGSVASTRFNQIKRKMETLINGAGNPPSGSVKNDGASLKSAPKAKPSKVAKVQTGKTRNPRKASVAAQPPKDGSKKCDNEEAKDGINERATGKIVNYGTAAARACIARFKGTKDDDSVADFDMAENEDTQNYNSELKFENFDSDEEDNKIVMENDDDGDADDEQV